MESELIELKGNALVISPHRNDVCDFKARLPQLISFFQKQTCKYYNISVEHPDTNWHLDIVYFITAERKNFDRNIKKLLTDFEKTHENSKTFKSSKGPDKGFQNFQNIKNSVNDILYRIGYNVKENPETSYGNIPEEFLERCKKHYHQESPVKTALNFPVVAPKASSLLEHLLQYKHSNPEVEYHDLYRHMIVNGHYSFLNVSDKVQKKALIELKLRNGVKLYQCEEHAFQYMNGLDNNMQFEGECENKLKRIYEVLTSSCSHKIELIKDIFD